MMKTLSSRRTVRLRALAVAPVLALALAGGAVGNANASDRGAEKVSSTVNSPATAADPDATYGPCTFGEGDSSIKLTTSKAATGEAGKATDALCKQ